MERSYVTRTQKAHVHAAHAQKNAGYFRLCHALFRSRQRATRLLWIGNGGANGLDAGICSNACAHGYSHADRSSVARSNASSDTHARTDADKRSDARANRYPAADSHLTAATAHP